jgi:peptide/nickel transport system permease protein
MLTFILRRLLMVPVVIFFSTLLVFLLVQFLPPGVRVSVFVNNNPSSFRDINEIIVANGLDQPIWVQYGKWITELSEGNLGWSQSAGMPVTEALLSFLPATLELTLFAIIPLVLGGIWLGTKSAVHHNRGPDHVTRVMSITGWSLPTFVVGLLLLMIFYGYLDWFQPGRISDQMRIDMVVAGYKSYTGMYLVDAWFNGPNWALLLDALKHMVLPGLTLAYVSWALIVRIMRSSMLNVLKEDYTTTARAKGLHENKVIIKHARRNAMIPVVTVSAIVVGLLLGGVVITETIFNYFGIGRWFARAAVSLDVAAVLGFTIFSSFLWVFTNLAVDVLYALIDPRVRLD